MGQEIGKERAFILSQDYKSPYMVITGMAHKPHQVEYKAFKKGQAITGRVHHKNGKPAFVMVGGALVFPLNVLKEAVVKEQILSNAEGKKEETVSITKKSGDKFKYIDAAILGGLLGFGAVWYAEKKAWIPVGDKKNKIIGVAIGAALTAYLVYRFSSTVKITEKKVEQ